jgi:hypothetical protein
MSYIVQFTHPGQEHGPDFVSSNHTSWNTCAHKRKFLAARGQYVNGDSLVDGDLMFWGEWEPCSRVERLALPGRNRDLPQWLHHPLWPCPEDCRLPLVVKNGKSDVRCSPLKTKQTGGTCDGDGPQCQNTDPYVFGSCFKYFSCKQVRHQFKSKNNDEVVATKLAQLDSGSIILFGSTRGTGREARFLLDTVFVVAERIEYDPDIPTTLPRRPEIDDVFLNASFHASFPKVGRKSSRGLKLAMYLGATFGHVDGVYSFAPAMIRNAKESCFPRVELRAEDFQNLDTPREILTNNLNSAVRKTEVSKATAKDVWTVVRDKCLHAGCVEGVKFSL